jgi:uncharacterized repeat protein (TIGR03803 family)
MILVATVVASRPLQGQTFTVLYAFTGGVDGGLPLAGLVRDGAGNLYGTTFQGGASGYGTVFKLDKTGEETVLHSFTAGWDGAYPQAGLVRDGAGNLYGTTVGGRRGSVVFRLNANGKETVLHTFDGADGSDPMAGLVRDAAGNLYGTTAHGGQGGCDHGCGVVFKLDRTGKETVLHSFTGTGGDGAYPYAGLIRDAAGNLYGTTVQGGSSDYGTVFKLDKTGKETVLYSFTGTGGDGGAPDAGLVPDAARNLYGTTFGGGFADYGTVFKLDNTGKETVLYSFTGGADGEWPDAGLVLDAKGNLYGTTFSGGIHQISGTVFKLDQTGNFTLLHEFTGGDDGSGPQAGLIWDKAGNLYGTTCCGGAYTWGVVFKLTP